MTGILRALVLASTALVCIACQHRDEKPAAPPPASPSPGTTARGPVAAEVSVHSFGNRHVSIDVNGNPLDLGDGARAHGLLHSADYRDPGPADGATQGRPRMHGLRPGKNLITLRFGPVAPNVPVGSLERLSLALSPVNYPFPALYFETARAAAGQQHFDVRIETEAPAQPPTILVTDTPAAHRAALFVSGDTKALDAVHFAITVNRRPVPLQTAPRVALLEPLSDGENHVVVTHALVPKLAKQERVERAEVRMLLVGPTKTERADAIVTEAKTETVFVIQRM